MLRIVLHICIPIPPLGVTRFCTFDAIHVNPGGLDDHCLVGRIANVNGAQSALCFNMTLPAQNKEML